MATSNAKHSNAVTAATSKVSGLKDAKGLLTEKGRAAILECKGTLSLSQASARFGVSRRTVGRIFHGAEHSSQSEDAQSQEIESLQTALAKQQKLIQALSETIEKLSQPQTSPASQVSLASSAFLSFRHRRELDPRWHQKPTIVGHRNYSSPYRDSPEMRVIVYRGLQVPYPSYINLAKEVQDQRLIKEHPVSPDCTHFPYPKELTPADRPVKSPENGYKDPAPGTYCNCDICARWRHEIAFEDMMFYSYLSAKMDYEIFHGRRRG